MIFGFFGFGGGEALLGFAEGVDEIGNKIFFFGAGFDNLFFVPDDNFVVGNFDDFGFGNGEFGVDKGFDGGTFDDNLLNEKFVWVDGEVDNAAELAAFFGFDFETDGVEIKFEDVFDANYVVGGNEFVVVVDHHAEMGVFADTGDVEEVGGGFGDEGAVEAEGENFEVVGVDDGASHVCDGAAGLNAEDFGTDKFGVCH